MSKIHESAATASRCWVFPTAAKYLNKIVSFKFSQKSLVRLKQDSACLNSLFVLLYEFRVIFTNFKICFHSLHVLRIFSYFTNL